MSKKVLFIISLFFTYFSSSQESVNLQLKNLTPPNSPAFVLMDITPTNITIPENIQAFSIQTLNSFTGNSNNGVSPNNYAIEFQPYWYGKRIGMNFFKYNNLTSEKDKEDKEVDDYNGYNPFGDIWKKASFSVAFMNGTFDIFDSPQSYLSIGGRTRLFSYIDQKQIERIKSSYKAYRDFATSIEYINIKQQVADGDITNDEGEEKIRNIENGVIENLNKTIQRKPIFAIDVAMAYSHFVGDKSQNLSDNFGRFGLWVLGDLALNLNSINKSHYFHIYGVFRYLEDGLNRDDDNNLFTKSDYDYGAKFEIELNALSLGYEYIKRDNSTDESRSFGTIRYRISNSLTLNGGFGKNFKSDSSLTTILGIQWGLDFGSSVSAK
ncbi:hypothetical protein [uncultured Tenacibaculum sp.]|uniref:hypothetical protein n=1 Tax=uncultured Tenacibaculum sp. TaxID=174713 RepID=UPI00262ABE1E|nr:hypothetical protein [uncultured Tenacibaculum sp.]